VNSEFRIDSVISSCDRHILSGSEDGCVYVWHLVDVSYSAQLAMWLSQCVLLIGLSVSCDRCSGCFKKSSPPETSSNIFTSVKYFCARFLRICWQFMSIYNYQFV